MCLKHSDPLPLQETSGLEYATSSPSPNSEDLAYLTLLTATILVRAIEEITGVNWMVMFPDGYSEGISTLSDWEGSVD